MNLRRTVIFYCAMFIAFYISVTYLLLKSPIYAEVTLLFRRMTTQNTKNRIFGYGTIMVDVKSLGRLDTSENEVLTMSSSADKLHLVKTRPSTMNICFKLSMNGSLIFSKESGILNRRNTVSSIFSVEMKSFAENRRVSEHCNCYITLDSLPGRSGNQMFQVAAVLGTAYRHDLIPVIPSDFPLSEWFDLPSAVDIKLTDAETYAVKPCGKYKPDIDKISGQKNWTLRGYFQSWKYFRCAESIIKKAFRIKDKYLNDPKSFVKNVSRMGTANICVHVRRGDLLDEVAVRKGYASAGLHFIYSAMNFYRKRFKTVQFIVLSDGMMWCKENIKDRDVIFSPFDWPAEDMALMTLCDHVIITSGTFGWWGAWLSGGTVVYFKGYPRAGSWLASQINRNDYYPTSWVSL